VRQERLAKAVRFFHFVTFSLHRGKIFRTLRYIYYNIYVNIQHYTD